MPSSTLHQLTGGLKYLRDTLFIFKTFHLHESHYVLSPLQILHSSIFPPNFCALYLKFKFFAILLHRFSLFTPCYNLLFCLICHQLYHHTLHQRTVLSLYVFTSSKHYQQSLQFSSNHLRSHFLLILLWPILHLSNIFFFLQYLKKDRNEMFRLITISILREIKDASEQAPLLLLF